jgi:hypothetical protein
MPTSADPEASSKIQSVGKGRSKLSRRAGRSDGRGVNFEVVRQYRDTLIRHRRSMLRLNTAVGQRILP